jgi:hypothetical protein
LARTSLYDSSYGRIVYPESIFVGILGAAPQSTACLESQIRVQWLEFGQALHGIAFDSGFCGGCAPHACFAVSFGKETLISVSSIKEGDKKMSEPTTDALVEQIGDLLNQGKVEEATALADLLKKRILELLREGNSAEAGKLMSPIMLLPPDRTFLAQYAALTTAQMSEEKQEPRKWWQFWK